MNRYAALVSAALATAVAYSAIPWKSMGPSEWAAWVQAFGSIIAIGAAIWIARRQWDSDREAEKTRFVREQKMKFDAWEGIASAAIDVVRDIPMPHIPLDNVEEYLASTKFRIKFLTANEALQSIQIENVHPFPIMATILQLRRDMSLLQQLLPNEKISSRQALGNWLRMQQQIEEIRAQSDDHLSVFESYAAAIRR
ncbi:hypothetical protein [Burkholderia cenocepacia]|uniref:hypothetical protein n=1 Tax=Burkholderia cenocepacia TaxID=95486 RepID=UPI001B91AE03|nr:hypothetical protein [Burkholderia cenocepacia]MBR8136883.1 hypothetical protein [Burkholderia cenocepacia]